MLSNFIWDTGVTNLKKPLAHAKDIAVRAIQFHLGYSCYEFEGAISTRQGQCRARYSIMCQASHFHTLHQRFFLIPIFAISMVTSTSALSLLLILPPLPLSSTPFGVFKAS